MSDEIHTPDPSALDKPQKPKEGFFRRKKNEVKAGVERRRVFASSIWTLFRNFLTTARERKLVREEIPFDEACQHWGIFTEPQLARARRANLFLAVFFYAIFLWCAYYLMKSIIVTHNFIAAFSSLMGIVTGVLTGTISLWRWQMLRTEKYTPFLSWLFRGTFVVMLALSLSFASIEAQPK